MKNLILLTGSALCLTSLAQASDVNISITSGGSNQVAVTPGATVDYEIRAELTDANNEGLALLCFDLEFDGGALVQAGAATGATQLNFASPLGLNNPAGFGGTPDAGKLLQVGGAQNTIKNSFASQPTGTVITGVGAPGSPVLFVTGSLTAPAAPGSYSLDATNLLANAIRQGETGTGEFWAVDAAGEGAVSGLTIDVIDCAPTLYCSAKVNSQGCTPTIAYSGSPTMSGPDDFHVTASNVINSKWGVLFWGNTPDNTPFQGGTICAGAPLQRMDTQYSFGSTSGNDCSGTYDQHISQGYFNAQAFTVGTQVYAQYFYRDPAHLDGTGFGLSNAIDFTVCP